MNVQKHQRIVRKLSKFFRAIPDERQIYLDELDKAVVSDAASGRAAVAFEGYARNIAHRAYGAILQGEDRWCDLAYFVHACAELARVRWNMDPVLRNAQWLLWSMAWEHDAFIGSALDVLETQYMEHRQWDDTRLMRFALWLGHRWVGTNAEAALARHPVESPFDTIAARWPEYTSEDVLAVCDHHLEHTVENRKVLQAECTQIDLVPVELAAIERLREREGHSAVNKPYHPLLATLLAEIPETMPDWKVDHAIELMRNVAPMP